MQQKRMAVQWRLRALGLGLAFAASGAIAAVGVNKTFNPTNVSAGQISTLTVILLNNNASTATGTAFTDNLPGSVVVANPANATTTCGAAVTATPSANNFSVSGGTIPAAAAGVAGQCTVTVDVLSPAAGVFINNIPVGAVSSSQGSNPQNANATLTVASLQPVSGAKAFLPTTLHGGVDTSTVTLTLTNPNGVALTNASLTDTLPVASLAIAVPPVASTTCGAGTVSTGANTATLTGGTIPANGNCTIRFNVVAVNPNVYVDGNIANTVGANALVTTQGVTNAVAFAANVRLQTGARVEKVFAPTPITTGGTSTLTVTVRNFNTTPLAGTITFTDTFPAGMTVASPVVTATTCAGLAFTPAPTAGGNSFTVSGGTLPGATAGSINNANCTVAINVVGVNAGANPATLNNTIPATNFGGVGFSSGTGALVVNAVTSVGASKVFVPTPVLQGATSTLTITLTNSNAAIATLTSAFTDNIGAMGAGITVAAAPTTTCGGVLTNTATTVTLAAGGTIPAAGSCTITIPIQVAANSVTGARNNTLAQGSLQTNQGRTQSAFTGVLTINPVLSVAKAFAPTIVVAGSDTRMTITLTRAAGAVALTGLAFTDTLPAGHLVSTTPNLVNTCGGTATASSGTNTVSLVAGGLVGGVPASSCTIVVNITTPAGAGSGVNTIAAGAVSSIQGFINPAAAAATVTRVVTSVTINKSFSPATVLVGATSQLTINFINTNANAIALTAGALTDNLPLGMAVAAAPAASNTCGGTFAPVAGATSVSLTNASIAANGSCRVQVNVVANAAGNLINPLAAGTFTSAQGVSNPLPASATLAATGVANLGVSKTDGVATVVPGTNTTYTIIANNAGPNAVSGANVVDNPPAGVTFTSWTCAASVGSACGNPSGSGPINELVSLLNAGTATYTVTAAIAPGATGTIANTVTIIVPPTVVDPTPGNNTATDTDTLTPVSALAVSKSDGSATYTPGSTAIYMVVVSNAGPSNATGATVSDPLPAGVTLSANVTCVAAGTANCGTVTGTTGQTSFGTTGATVGVGGANTLTFTVPVAFASGMVANPLLNTVTASAPTSPIASGSDSDGRLAVAALAISKTDGSATYTPGGTATYTIVVANAGPTNASSVSVSDPLPGGVTLSANATCVSAGAATCGAVTGTTGQSSFGTTGATIAAGAGNTLTFTAPVAFAAGMTTNPLVNTVTATDPTSPVATASDSDTLAAVAALAVTKTDGSATYTPGGTATYTVTVTNAGPSTASNVTVSDPLPVGVTLNANAVCVATGLATCGTVTGTTGQTSFGTTGATLAAGIANKIVFTVPVAFASGMSANPLVNTATATDPASPPASGSDSDTLSAVAALAVTKTDGSLTYTPGGTATYTVVVTNAGPSNATNVTVTDPLPAGVTLNANAVCLATGVATCGTVTGTTGQTSFGATNATIAAGGGNSLTFTAPVKFAAGMATNPLVNTATATDPASPPANGTDSDTLSAVAALAITKTDGSATYTPGGTATYTVAVTNAGPSNAGSVTVSDPLPAGVTLNANATCVAAGAASCGAVTGTTGQTSFGTTGATVGAGAGNSLTFTVPVKFASGMTTNPLVNAVTATDPASPPATGTDSDTLSAVAALVVTKTDGSPTYTPGSAAIYTVTVTNTGPSNASNVTVSDSLPVGVTLSANATCVAVGAATCGTVTGTAGQTSFGTTGATVGAGAGNSLTFTLPVAFASGMSTNPLVNTATATDPASPPASGTDSDALSAVAALAVTKTDGSPTYTPGNTATYTVTVTNAGPSNATNVTVTDPLPVGVTLNANATCVAVGTATCGTVTGTTGQTSFGTTNATIAAGAANSLVFTVPVKFASGMTTNPLVNTATATDPASPPATGSDSDALLAVAALAVSKTDGSPNYTPGGTATYTVVATNTGPSNAANVTVNDPLPAGVTLNANATCLAAGTAICGTVTGTTGQASFGTTGATIGAGAGNSLTFTVPVKFASSMTANPLVNTATATDPASPPANGSDSDALAAQATLVVTKTDGSPNYTPGGTATYTVVVTNTGLSNANNATVTDPLPASVTLSANVVCVASGSSNCGAVTGTTGQTSFGTTAATVAAGAGNALTFTVPVAFAPGMTTNPLVNTATATDPASPPATGSDSDALVAQVSLNVVKTDGSATYTPGGTATYTITVTNGGPSSATNVTLTDALPAGVTLTANVTCAPTGASTCGTVTGATGQTSLGTTGASVGAGGINKLVFTVPVAFAPGMVAATIVNAAMATDLASSGPGSTATGTDTDSRNASVALAVVKDDGSATYTPGGTATYAVTVSNGGPSVATNLTVTDALPAGVTLTANVTCVASGTATCGTVTGTTGQTSFGTTGATVGAAVADKLVFTVPVAFASSLTTDPLVNTATASDLDASGPGNTATGSDSDTRSAAVTLLVTKTDGATTYTPGGTGTYTVTVENTGTTDALGVTVTDVLPAGLTLTANALCVANGTSSCGTVTGTTGQTSFGTTAAVIVAGGANTIVFTIPVAFAAGMATNPLINTAVATDVPTGATASGSDSDALSSNVTLSVSKTDGSATYTPGGTATYVVTVANTGLSDALNVNVTDALPAGVTLSANATCVANGSSACGTVTGTAGQTSFGSTAARVNTGGANTLVFTVPVAFASGMTTNPLVNTATATDIASGNTASGNDSDTLSAAVTLGVAKTDGSATYTPGGTATYTVTVINSGLSDALDVTVIDPLPAGVTLNANAVCVANGSSSCGTVTGATGQSNFGATTARINAGAANSIVFTVPVAFAAGMTTNPLINTATATDVATGITANGSDSDVLSANVSLAVTKTDGSATYTPGGTATYTVTVANTGVTDALNVTITDPLPAGVTLNANAVCVANGSSTCGAVTGTTGQAAFGTTAARIDAGAANTLVFTVPVAFAAGMSTNPLVNTATATDVASGATANGSDSDTLASNVTLAVAKSDGSPTYTPGGTATYTVTVQNTGVSDAQNVTVTDPLPAGVTLNANAVCVANGSSSCGTITGTTGQTSFGAAAARVNVGAGNALVFTVPVAFASGMSTNPLVNTATATDVASGATASGSDSDTLVSNVTLAVAKTDGSATYTPGGTATYTVTVQNTGVSSALNVTITDPLPTGVTLTANAVCVANGSSSCGTVTGTTGQTSFGATAARVDAGAGNALVFTVPIAFSPGMSTNPLTNTATAIDLGSGASASGSDSDTLLPAVGLLVSKTDGSATYTPGGTATYTIVVTNGGPSNAGSLTVSDTLPAGVTLNATAICVATGSATCGTVMGATGATSFGTTGATLAAGAGNRLTFTVGVSFASGMTTDPLVNTVTAADPSAPTPASASDSDTRAASADVGIVKTGPASLIPGNAIAYTLTLTNAGPSTADGATFNDNVPGVITGVAASCGGAAGGAACGAVTVVGNNVSGIVTLLPVGGSVVVTITGTVSGAATGSFTNIGTVSPPLGTSDPNPGNASSSATTSVGPTTATQVPVNAPWALALLLASIGILGARSVSMRKASSRH